jgi:DNA recombination protein RmuC
LTFKTRLGSNGGMLIYFVGGLGVGVLTAYFILRPKWLLKDAEVQEVQRRSNEKIELLRATQESLSNSFKLLSSEALQRNNQSFLELAQTQLEKFQEGAKQDLTKRQDQIAEVIKPVKESLERVDQKIQLLEKTRAQTDASLIQQVRSLMDLQKDLRTETANLVTALRAPQGRGLWGEMQLKRVVEMAGMLEYCDFTKQSSVSTDEGRLRPDLIIRLPGGKNIVVDAKTPLLAYLEAIQQTTVELKRDKFSEHSRQVRKQLEQLGRKSYWDQFQPAPEFVVLFLPGESFFSAALEFDPTLIELGVAQNVIISTPTTLIALLRAVAYGWRQEKLTENAKAIGELGKEMYKRLSDMGGHLSRLGKNLENSVEAYNAAVATVESRVLVSGRRFKELESTRMGVEIDVLTPIEKHPRSLQAPELLDEQSN